LLEEVVPHSAVAGILIFFILLWINMLVPRMKTTTRRVAAVLTTTKSVAAVVAVFTSFSFFGPVQAGALLKATAAEKFARLRDQSVARAELVLSARVSDGETREAQHTRSYLDAVYNGVVVDESVTPFDDFGNRYRAAMLKKPYDRAASRRAWLLSLVKARVTELKDAMRDHPAVHRALAEVGGLGSLLFLGRQLTDQERADSAEKFGRELDKFAGKIAEDSAHPLMELLKGIGAPELIQAIIKDLYKTEVERLAEHVSAPLAEALFDHPMLAQEPLPLELEKSLSDPVFDSASLPVEIAEPTKASRIESKAAEEQRARIVEKAIKAVR
jgi:hypothetical protein